MLLTQLSDVQRQALDRNYYCRPSQLRGYLKTLRKPIAAEYLSEMLKSSYFTKIKDRDFMALLLLYTAVTESGLTDAKNPSSTASGFFQILAGSRVEARRVAPWPLPEWGPLFRQQYPYALSLYLSHVSKYNKEIAKAPASSIILPWATDPVVNKFLNLRWWYGGHWGPDKWKDDPISGVARTYAVLYANPNSLKAIGATSLPSALAQAKAKGEPSAWEKLNAVVHSALENLTPMPTLSRPEVEQAQALIGEIEALSDAQHSHTGDSCADGEGDTSDASRVLIAYPDMMAFDEETGMYFMAPHVKEEFKTVADPSVRAAVLAFAKKSKAKLLVTSVKTSYTADQRERGGNHANGAVDFLPIITDAQGKPVRWTNSKGQAITPRFWANPLFVRFFASFNSLLSSQGLRLGIETDHIHLDTNNPKGVFLYTTARPKSYANDVALEGHEPALIPANTYLNALKMTVIRG